MQNPVVLDEIEDMRAAAPLSKPVHVRLARNVSTFLAPAMVSVPLVVVVSLYHARNLLAACIYAGIALFFLSFGPLAYILLGVRSGKFTDVDVSRRSQRTAPFLFGLISVTMGLFILMYLHGPKNLETVLIGTAVSGAILMVTTWWWKISIHSATLGGALTMLTALYGIVILPAFVLLVLVSWSRVVLQRHTIAQVIGGSLVSIILTIAVIMLRGI